MHTHHREPQLLGHEGTLERMARILAARNIDPADAAALPDDPEPFSPLDALLAGMPPRYQAAAADHPMVLDWVGKVTEAAVAPSRGARRSWSSPTAAFPPAAHPSQRSCTCTSPTGAPWQPGRAVGALCGSSCRRFRHPAKAGSAYDRIR